jgi:hypothetical protein
MSLCVNDARFAFSKREAGTPKPAPTLPTFYEDTSSASSMSELLLGTSAVDRRAHCSAVEDIVPQGSSRECRLAIRAAKLKLEADFRRKCLRYEPNGIQRDSRARGH